MSLPDEKRRSLDEAEQLLMHLLTFDRIPRAVLRERALRILRHYPSSVERKGFTMWGER